MNKIILIVDFSCSSVTGKLGHVEFSPVFSSVVIADLEANFSSVVESEKVYNEYARIFFY